MSDDPLPPAWEQQQRVEAQWKAQLEKEARDHPPPPPLPPVGPTVFKQLEATQLGGMVSTVGMLAGGFGSGALAWQWSGGNILLVLLAMMFGAAVGRALALVAVVVVCVGFVALVGLSFLPESMRPSVEVHPLAGEGTPTMRTARIHVEGENANLRDAPDGAIIGAIPQGTAVQVLQMGGDSPYVWWQVQHGDQTGWVRGDILQFDR